MPKLPTRIINKDVQKKYWEAVTFINSFANTSFRHNHGAQKRDSTFYLDRTKQFLELAGSPEKDFKYVHITGTAGKGSVSTLTHAMFVESSKTTGLFTSPFVTTAIEMIKVDDHYISPEAFTAIVNKLKPAIKKAQKTELGGPSAFELFMTIAMIHFKNMKCEWVVLEVGLGGRYDSTNVIVDPKVTAITTIDYDHTEILGNTLEKIAYDKAGIIKKGSEFFTTESRLKLLSLFKKVCREKGATYHSLPKKRSYKDRNILLASSIASACGIIDEAIQKGIEATRMPCRFEPVSEEPLVILDGAHNRAKMRTTVKNLSEYSYKKLIVIFGLANTNKNSELVAGQIIPLADSIILAGTSGADRKSIHPSQLQSLVGQYKKKGVKVSIVEKPQDAIEQALKIATKNDCILVTGSFFLAGEIRKRWFPESFILKNLKSF